MTSPYLHAPARVRRKPNWRRWVLVLIGLAVLFLAPALAHSQPAAEGAALLTWTAPGADALVGEARLYDVRVFESPIDPSNWALARQVPNLPLPHAPGTREFMLVTGLDPAARVYFALRSRDEAGNWSGILSVVRTDRVTDGTGPQTPTGLTATLEQNWVRLHWALNSAPHLLGYTVFRATAAAGPYSPLNAVLLNGPEYVDTSLPTGANRLWYAVTATDDSHRQSDRSDSVLVEIGTSEAPVTWQLETGYPNPSRLSGSVTFPVIVPSQGADKGTLVVTDNGGRRVWQTPLAGTSPGRQLLTWNGRNEDGRVAAPGIYRVMVIAGGERTVSRIVRVP